MHTINSLLTRQGFHTERKVIINDINNLCFVFLNQHGTKFVTFEFTIPYSQYRLE